MYETSIGRVGGLICWENYMPLARYALYAGGVQIYAAPTWDHGDGWLATLRHIAREGRAFVIGCSIAMRREQMPADLAALYPADREWINPGGSAIVAPNGKVLAGRSNAPRRSSTPRSISRRRAPRSGTSTSPATTRGRTSSTSASTARRAGC